MREIKFRYWNGSKDLNQEAIKTHLNKYIARNDKDFLMQFTGLFDKQGVEIYEGDILQDYDDDRLGIVSSIKGVFVVVWENEIFDLFDWSNECVVGNIYETPELLKR